MAKRRYHKGDQQHFKDPMEIERNLIIKISDTGREQMRRRRKAGLSSFYAKNGKIIEVLPNNSTHERQTIRSKWITLDRNKRTVTLK